MAVAVNVTVVPLQMAEEGLATIETLTGKEPLVLIVIAFEVAGLPVAHWQLEVITQVTTSLLTNEDVVKVEPVPAFTPLIFHW